MRIINKLCSRRKVGMISALALAALAPWAPRARAASYSATVSADAPVSYYRLEETTGTTANDSGSFNKPGTYTGGYTLDQAGIPGGDATDRAVAFNGTGYLQVGRTDGSYAAVTYPVTIEAFVKSTQTTGTPCIVGLTNNSTTDGSELLGLYLSGGIAALRYRNPSAGPTAYTATNVNIADGKYHQVVGVYASATSRSLYVDGQLLGTQTSSFTAPTINTLGVGALARNGVADFLNGTVDEPAVYDTALSSATILQHYQASGIPEPTTLGLMMFSGLLVLARRPRRLT